MGLRQRVDRDGDAPMAETNKKPSFRRRLFLVDRQLQWKYFAVFASIGAGLTGAWGGLAYAIRREVQQGLGLPTDLDVPLAGIDASFLWLALATLMVTSIALGLFGMLITHRIAGPVWVITRHMKVLAQGDYPHIRELRRNDELKDMYAVFTHLVSTLRARELEEIEQLDRALFALKPLPEAAVAITAIQALRDRKRARRTDAAPEALATEVSTPASANAIQPQ